MLLSCIIRFQVRYGEHWAPAHLLTGPAEILVEIILAPGEVFTHVKVYTTGYIEAMEFSSNLRNFTRSGAWVGDLPTVVPLDGLLYFSGAGRAHFGGTVTRIMPHRDTCDTP